MCPVCHKKLKQNLKFDSKERFEALAEVCERLGFDDEAKVYRKLLKDVAMSGIQATSRSSSVSSRASNVSNRRGGAQAAGSRNVFQSRLNEHRSAADRMRNATSTDARPAFGSASPARVTGVVKKNSSKKAIWK